MISTAGKLALVLSFIATSILQCLGQVPRVTKWERVVSQMTTEDLECVVFIDDSAVVAVGDNGCIRRGVPTREFPAVAGQFGRPTYRTVVSDGGSMVVCAGDSGSIGVSKDSGRSWSVSLSDEIGNVWQVEIEQSGAILLATSRGLFRKVGNSAPVRLLAGDMTGVALHPDGSIVAGYRSGAVATSRDVGVTWQTDDDLSTSWPIVKLIRSDSTVFVLHQRFITWRTSDAIVDTSYIPSGTDFTFTDLAISGDQWWATSEDLSLGHAYSVDNGRSWVVSNGFKIRASRALAVRSGVLVCVGMRGAFVYGPQDSAVDQTFKFYGFATPSTEVPMGTAKGLRAVADTLYVLWEKPAVRVVRYAAAVDTLYESPSSLNIEARALWIKGSRVIVVMDTLANFETPSGWVTKRRFRICAGLAGESSYTVVDAPSWDLPSTTSYADDDGNIYVGCVGRPYVFRYSVTSGTLDSLRNFPLPEVGKILGRMDTLVVVSTNSIAVSTDLGENWTVSSTTLPFKPSNSCIGALGRLCIARLEVSGSSGTLQTATSDDWGSSWDVQPTKSLDGARYLLVSMEADETGRIITSGLGDRVLLSLDNGQTYYAVSTPTPATATIYSSIYVGADEIVIGGMQDVLLRGQLDIISAVKEDANAEVSSTADCIVVSLDEYDVLGRLVSTYEPGREFRLREFIDLRHGARSGASILICRLGDHTVRAIKVMW